MAIQHEGPSEASIVSEADIWTEFDRNQELLEQQLHQLEMARLETRLSKLRSRAPARSSAMDRRDIDSMIAMLSRETIGSLGGSPNTVRTEMAQVIQRYPGSRGAMMAAKFIEHSHD